MKGYIFDMTRFLDGGGRNILREGKFRYQDVSAPKYFDTSWMDEWMDGLAGVWMGGLVDGWMNIFQLEQVPRGARIPPAGTIS